MANLPNHFFVTDAGALYDTRAADWSSAPALRPIYSRHFHEIGTAARLKAAIRAGAYAWPGGYETFFVCDDGGALCHDCARLNFRNILGSMQNQIRDGWRISFLECAANVDGSDGGLRCDHCSKVVVEAEDNEEEI